MNFPFVCCMGEGRLRAWPAPHTPPLPQPRTSRDLVSQDEGKQLRRRGKENSFSSFSNFPRNLQREASVPWEEVTKVPDSRWMELACPQWTRALVLTLSRRRLSLAHWDSQKAKWTLITSWPCPPGGLYPWSCSLAQFLFLPVISKSEERV